VTKLTEMLDKYRKGASPKVKVGIMGDKTYPDGELVAYVGYVNEYGYKGTVPGRTQMVYHKLDKDGNIANGGKFVKKSKASIERLVVVPSYELNIPSRPFFRTAVAENKDALKELIAKVLRAGSVMDAAHMAGEFMADKLQESVMTWSDPPNAKSTQAAKGYNAPLRANDKLLRNSFTYEIEQ
jgi:hypothetical protein